MGLGVRRLCFRTSGEEALSAERQESFGSGERQPSMIFL